MDQPEEQVTPETGTAQSGSADDDSADAVIQAIDELADRASEIEQLRNELADMEDRLKRQAAEFQNYRRRTEKEKSQMVEFGKTLVVQPLLDVVDDFRRSLEATADAEKALDEETTPAYDSLKSGVEMVYQKLMDELGKLGVEPIEAEGQPFDENEHEALMQQPAPEGIQPGTVLNEIQKGYRLGDRVIRHARVVVAS